MSKLTVGSLFAGIGGFDLGLERTGGFEVKWQVEIDPYCQRVLAKHWPDVQRHGDIRTVTGVERVDVLCGGFPCQDISNAGKRAGIDGERSGLWSEYVRLICEIRPRYVIVENVAALLGRGMGRVLGDLSACGYDAEWSVISACSMGAPHMRERLFVLAYADGISRDRFERRRIVGAPDRYTEWHVPQQWAFNEPPRVADGVSARMDKPANGAIGNAIVPQIAEWIGNRILEAEA